MNEILEIALDNSVKYTRYWTLNTTRSNSIFFEGSSSQKLKPLAEAKKWAKEKGYKQLVIVSLKRNKSDKTYFL